MSLIVCVYVEEGIVLASDSRTSYNLDTENTKFVGVHSTNTTNKTFLCPNNVGISACGDASVHGKPIAGFIESFIREKISENTDIDAIPELIKNYFNQQDSGLNATFIIAGYKKESEKYIQKIYSVATQNEGIQTLDTSSQGVAWNGEKDVLDKLLNPVYKKDENNNFTMLAIPRFEYNLYTLQDAIDFAKYGIKTTIDTMRFQTIPETVGEPIDILVIKPGQAKWLLKKELKG